MLVSPRGEGGARKGIVDRLGFLQAENVRLMLVKKPLDQADAETNGVDIPGGYFHDLIIRVRGPQLYNVLDLT
jgi:hypothetical protein